MTSGNNKGDHLTRRLTWLCSNSLKDKDRFHFSSLKCHIYAGNLPLSSINNIRYSPIYMLRLDHYWGGNLFDFIHFKQYVLLLQRNRIMSNIDLSSQSQF